MVPTLRVTGLDPTRRISAPLLCFPSQRSSRGSNWPVAEKVNTCQLSSSSTSRGSPVNVAQSKTCQEPGWLARTPAGAAALYLCLESSSLPDLSYNRASLEGQRHRGLNLHSLPFFPCSAFDLSTPESVACERYGAELSSTRTDTPLYSENVGG